jgi:putative ABC transport system permease protein
MRHQRASWPSRLYRRLLLLFPFEFRREFGSEMTEVFEAQRAEARAKGGRAMARLWTDTVSGFVRTAPREHLSSLRQDMALGFRMLARTPVFTTTAIVTLALGIGANVAVYSLVRLVLLNPLPVRQPSRLVTIQVVDRQSSGYTPLSTDNFRDLRDQQSSFTAVAAWVFAGVRLQAQGTEPQELFAAAVSGDYFDLLGVRASHGRALSPADDGAPGRNPVVVLSHGLWTRAFGAQPSVLGSTIGLNGKPFTVIGTTPPEFKGTQATFEMDMYVPLSMYDTVTPGTAWFTGRRWRWLTVIGRLRDGVSVQEAHAATTLIGDRLAEAYPDINRGRSLAVLPLSHTLLNPNQHSTLVSGGWVLLALAVIVLLAACVNLVNLLLARAAERAREVAVRTALGASRWRVVRQLLTESLLLGIAGGLTGLVLAYWVQQWLWASRPQNLLRAAVELSLGRDVLGLAVLLSIGTGVVFGLLPGLQVSRTDVVSTLKESGRQPALAGSRRLRAALVVGEVALSVVALIAAGLFIRSLQGAQQIDPGFRSDRLLRLVYNLRGSGYDLERSLVFHEQLLEKLRATPGIAAAAVANRPPLGGGGGNTLNIPGRPAPPGALGFFVQLAEITPGYFDTLGIPLIAGRDFSADDRAGHRLVAIVNETMARRFWNGEDAVGRQFTSTSLTAPIEVVGVARDSKYVTLGEETQPFFYLPLAQRPSGSGIPLTLLVASTGPPDDAAPLARAAMKELDASIPLTNVTTGSELVHAALWAPRMAATLVSAFGIVALALATIGIYGVTAYTVAQSSQEIGLRMALGATPRTILGMFVGRSARLAGFGALVGVVASLIAAGGVASLLYTVDPRDPLTFIVAPAGLVLVAILAAYGPARRAATTDPAITLR